MRDELAVAVDELVGHVARAGDAGADGGGLALVHRGVLALDGVEVDGLAVDLLRHDAHLGDGDLVAVVELVVERRLDDVVLVDLDAELPRGRGATVSAATSFLTGLGAADLDGEGLRGDDRQAHAPAVDVRAAAGGEVGAGEAAADLVEGAVDVGGGDPVGRGLAVDLELEGAAEAHRDRCRRRPARRGRARPRRAHRARCPRPPGRRRRCRPWTLTCGSGRRARGSRSLLRAA